MSLKPGEVVDVQAESNVIYYDGFTKRAVDLELLRLFIGEPFKEMKELVGHSIQIYKDRSGRINSVQIID